LGIVCVDQILYFDKFIWGWVDVEKDESAFQIWLFSDL
jgi:hypothetical protein